MKKISLLAIILVLSTCVIAQRTWQNELPQDNELHDIQFVDLNVGYAANQYDTKLKTTNSGSNWVIQNLGTTNDLFSVCFVTKNNSNIGFAVGGTNWGSPGKIFKTTNGNDWDLTSFDTLSLFYSVCFADSNTGYVVGEDGIILKTTDCGTNWTIQHSGTSNALYSVFFINAEIGYATGYRGVLLKTVDGGINWEKLIEGSPDVNKMSVFFTDSVTGYLAGNYGYIMKTTDGGMNWVYIHPQTGGSLNSVFFTDSDTGYVVGGGLIYNTNDGGLTWSIQYPQDYNAFWLNSVYFYNNSTGYIVSAEGIVLKTTDAGINWELDYSIASTWINSIYCLSEDTCYAVGLGGIILKRTNGGGNVNVNENEKAEPGFSISPNPATSNITISGLKANSNIFIEIFDLQGKRIMKKKYLYQAKYDIDVSSLSEGIYVVKVQTENYILAEKFVIQ
jgi:photosystem II stability/assembly factor-like uncharacterized protein